MDTTSIKATDIDNEKLDTHLKAEDYFDAEGFPEAILVITDADDANITADLTIKGQTFPVSFDVDLAD
jgi:polyisoprenoid-binding protein YceI